MSSSCSRVSVGGEKARQARMEGCPNYRRGEFVNGLEPEQPRFFSALSEWGTGGGKHRTPAEEVPHAIAVRIDEYTERGDSGAYIRATLFVERDSQKGIVIGHAGTMLKRIGTHARKEIEEMSGRKVFLRLNVKVRKNWRNDEKTLRLFGFKGEQ